MLKKSNRVDLPALVKLMMIGADGPILEVLQCQPQLFSLRILSNNGHAFFQHRLLAAGPLVLTDA